MASNSKIIIYQVLTRLYGNRCQARKPYGTIEENGCGKLNDFTPSVLKQLREMGVSHVWYTGVLRHASTTDYARHGIPCQHPAVVKGRAGSPYAVADYYDVCPDLAVDVDRRMEEFERLVNRTHRAGLKVVIDFVPNHVARQYHSIARPDGVRDLGEDDDTTQGFLPAQNNFYYCPGQQFCPPQSPPRPPLGGENGSVSIIHPPLGGPGGAPYYEMPAKATGNDHFDNAPSRDDWYETVKLCYGVDYYAGRVPHFDPVPSTWHKMLHILLFWAGKGVDAFRCDMAEMVPAEFWDWAIARVHEQHPDTDFIGEVYDPQQYRRYLAAGFSYLYDKVGMYDTVRDVVCHRRPTSAITQAWQQTDDIRRHMLYFLENHDEQRLASDFFAGDAFKGVPALVVSALLQQGPFMLYFGQERGERGMDQEGYSGRDGRTSIFDYWALDTFVRPLTDDEQRLAHIYNKVLGLARTERAVAEGLMFDLMYANTDYTRQYAFLRTSPADGRHKSETLLVVANFDDAPVTMHLRLPAHAFDYLGLAAGQHTATDLLDAAPQTACGAAKSGQPCTLDLQPDGTLPIALAPHGAVVLKLA